MKENNIGEWVEKEHVVGHNVALCGQDSLHPYECNHDETCPHCTSATFEGHDPKKCWLCCDGDPDENKPVKLVDKPYKPHENI